MPANQFTNITVPVGTTTVGPFNAGNNESSITLTVDRTVAGGLNSLTADTTISLAADQSDDGGSTWQNIAAVGTTGGMILGKDGNPVTAVTLMSTLNPGTSRKLRLTAVVGGPSSVRVSGTVTSA